MGALREHREGEANELLKELIPRLKDYLRVVLDAEEDDAEEAIHRAFLDVYEKILKGNIKREKYIFRYMILACKNAYINYQKEKGRFDAPSGDRIDYLSTPARQVENLMDHDRQRILRECLEELEEDSREFIEYLLENPDTTTREASRLFDMSEANVRTKKTRLQQRLHVCFKIKWER